MKTDLDTLKEQYQKYRDKKGKKAVNLYCRTKAFEAWKELIKMINEAEKSLIKTKQNQ